MMKRTIIIFGLFTIHHSPFIVADARAQFSGSVSLGGQRTNNVQSLDTIAPDQLLLPAFELNYDVHPSNVSTISLTGSYTPSFYAVNPGLSFQETSIGATGVFYLSNQDAISAEAIEKGSEDEFKLPRSSHLLGMEQDALDPLRIFQPASPVPPRSAYNQQSKNDSLVDLAVSALYTLSGELDSTDISPKGISKARVSELEDLRDSISDVVSTIADLLDSAGYSESTSEVVITELQSLRVPLLGLMPQTKPSHTDAKLLDAAIHFLQQAKPEADYLSTAPTPSAPPGASTETKKLFHSLVLIQPTTAEGAAAAPNITLLTSSTRLRMFGHHDAAVHEDADDSGASTMATALTVPVVYTNHAGVHYSPADSLLFGGNYGGNPNDNKMLTFGASVEGMTSTNFSLRGSYDYTHEEFPFDSVYSSTENRFTLTPRIALGKTTVLIGEGAVGFKKYLNPLVVTITPAKYDTIIRPKKGDTIEFKKAVTQTARSNFDQFSYGIGVAQFIGERWALGALMAFNDNPNLRAYVTNADIVTGAKGKVRAAAQIADDEYTYNLGRYTLFSDARIFGDLDFGADLSYEHRVYGSAFRPNGVILDSGRTENGTFFNASLSKLFPFEYRLIGVFNGLLLEGKLEFANVVATQSLYSYTFTDFTLTTTLSF